MFGNDLGCSFLATCDQYKTCLVFTLGAQSPSNWGFTKAKVVFFIGHILPSRSDVTLCDGSEVVSH